MTQTSSSHHRIVIVGGGTAGITVAARLRRKGLAADIAIIEPSDKHYYQPAWTLVGGGAYSRKATERPEASVIPSGVTWIRDAVTEVRPDENCVLTRDGGRTQYDFLVMAPGIQIDWGKIPGLEESVGKDGVCSNFSYDTADSTWRFIREFQGGKAWARFDRRCTSSLGQWG